MVFFLNRFHITHPYLYHTSDHISVKTSITSCGRRWIQLSKGWWFWITLTAVTPCCLNDVCQQRFSTSVFHSLSSDVKLWAASVISCCCVWMGGAVVGLIACRSWVKNQWLGPSSRVCVASLQLPPSDTRVQLTGESKLARGSNVRGRIVCLLVLNCRPVQGVYLLTLWQLGQAPRGEESRRVDVYITDMMIL